MTNFSLDGESLSSTHKNQSLQIFRAPCSEQLTVFGHTARVLLPAQATQNRVAILEWQVAAQQSCPESVQHKADCAFVVQKGVFQFSLHRQTFHAQPGDVIYVPQGACVGFQNVIDEPGVLLLISLGGNWESYFRACAQAFPDAAAPYGEEFTRICNEHGLEFCPEDYSGSPQKSPRFILQAEAEKLMTPHGPCRVLLNACETGGDFALLQLQVDALVGAPLHIHSREDEIFVVQSGSFEYSTGRQRLRAEAGDTIYGPRHTPHMFRCISAQTGTLLDILLPGACADYFRHSADLWTQGGMSEKNIAALNERYGIEFLPTI